MVDTVDSKSSAFKSVSVQVRPPVPILHELQLFAPTAGFAVLVKRVRVQQALTKYRRSPNDAVFLPPFQRIAALLFPPADPSELFPVVCHHAQAE